MKTDFGSGILPDPFSLLFGLFFCALWVFPDV